MDLHVRPRIARDWSTVDWSLPSAVIAKELQTTEAHASLMRRRYAPKTVQVRTPKAWDKVDWTQSNTDLAAALGVSENYISVRRRRHAPETRRKPRVAI